MSKPFALLMSVLVLTATAAVAMGGLKATDKTQKNVLNKVETKAERLLN